jgi:hypothetical protein
VVQKEETVKMFLRMRERSSIFADMGLSYHFKFGAPARTQADDLVIFLKGVELSAKTMGFGPTMVINATFDKPEHRSFARRLTKGLPLEDERLKGVSMPNDPAVWQHDLAEGTCLLLPASGVLLVVTDEGGCESAFGFFKYPDQVKDIYGKILAETGLDGAWHFEDFIDSPDPRFRKIVDMFAENGFLQIEEDEYAR